MANGGLGRGGRGAALLKALEELKKRPGNVVEESNTERGPGLAPAAATIPQMGRGALLRNLMELTIDRKAGGDNSAVSPEIQRPYAPEGGRGIALMRHIPRSPKPREAQPPVKQIAHLEATSTPPPVLKHGHDGHSLSMTANYIKLNLSPGKGIFEYAISFNPQIDSKNMRFILLREQENVLGKTRTFDGAKLYLPFKLKDQTTILNGKHPVDQSPVTIYIKFVCQRQFDDCIHLYNVLFKRIMKILRMTQIGRNYFDSRAGIQVPQHKLEIWPGYVTAVEEFEGGLMLQCDASHRVLRTTTVLDVLTDLTATNPNKLKEMAVKTIVGCIVMTRYNNKTYRVDEIAWNLTPRSTFTNISGEEMSYLHYYRKAYGITIHDEAQPLLLHRAKHMKGKDETRLICLVPELSVLTGLTDEMRSDFRIMKDIAVHTRITPNQRIYSYKKFIENIQSNEAAKKELSSWGLTLDDNTVQLKGRVMKPQNIILKTGPILMTPNSDWGRELTRDGVITAVDLNCWCLIFFHRDARKAADFVDTMMKICPQLGIKINRPSMIELRLDRNEAFLQAIRENVNPKLQLVVVICPTIREDRYSAIKKLCCCEMPVPSQIINSRTIGHQQKLRAITQKIALQINCKLGGELWAINIPLDGLMVCGIDVYHDTLRNGRSVAGFVSSINASLTRWYSRSCFQEPNQELVDGLRLCFIGAIKKYFDINHALPKRIVIFRDGVSDGQLNFVAKYEVEQLCIAFQGFYQDVMPMLSVIVVQKRINTRLFVKSRENQLDNPPPGTVMDHSITRRNWYDFFLISQHVNQGTVSPTHYIVVYDTNNLAPDKMQMLSYKLTHLYYNWSGTIRVPAPCQYAHKLAALVGQNLHKEASGDLSDRLYFL